MLTKMCIKNLLLHIEKSMTPKIFFLLYNLQIQDHCTRLFDWAVCFEKITSTDLKA